MDVDVVQVMNLTVVTTQLMWLGCLPGKNGEVNYRGFRRASIRSTELYDAKNDDSDAQRSWTNKQRDTGSRDASSWGGVVDEEEEVGSAEVTTF